MNADPGITSEPAQTGASDLPLAVDVDGTVLRTDLLLESLWAALGADLLATLKDVFTSFRSVAVLKRALLARASPDLALMPTRPEVLALIAAALGTGRRVALVSGADQILVDALARQLGLPGAHFGSDGKTNLTDQAKARLLAREFGVGGYDYVGDSAADLKAWQGARSIIVVAPDAGLAARLRALGPPVQTLGSRWRWSGLLAELRPHQWVKNLLVLLPLLAAHSFSVTGVTLSLTTFVAFCAITSSLYIVNDLLDLASDRKHREKRHRPIAAGDLPIGVAMATSVTLAVVALVISGLVGREVMLVVVTYAAGSLSYSLWLKHLAWVDLCVLACLYTLRVVAGGAAAELAVSGWLIAFCLAVFFVLSGVKRLTEIARSAHSGQLPGRGYARSSVPALVVVTSLGIVAAMVVFLGYSFSAHALELYRHPMWLRLAVIPMVLWLARMTRISSQGREDYDPLLFMARDGGGLLIIALGLCLVGFAV